MCITVEPQRYIRTPEVPTVVCVHDQFENLFDDRVMNLKKPIFQGVRNSDVLLYYV